jgi:ribosomal protein S21
LQEHYAEPFLHAGLQRVPQTSTGVRVMLVVVQNNDIDFAIRRLKKELQKSGLESVLKLQSIPKRSERKREKARRAELRKRKSRWRRLSAEVRRYAMERK